MKENLLAIPVSPEQFSAFIEKARIFDKTKAFMQAHLKGWYSDDPDSFTECMRADLITVLEQYHFYNEFVSITKILTLTRLLTWSPARFALPMKRMIAVPGIGRFLMPR